MIGEPLLLGDEGGYNLTRSLRFRSSATASLSKTLTTPTSNTTWTLSMWVKRGILSQASDTSLFVGSDYTGIYFRGSGSLDAITFYKPAAYVFTSASVYRDPAAWYHIVVSSNGTTVALYVNGVSAGSYTGTLPNLNSAVAHTIGVDSGSVSKFDGYMAEVNFIDGQALAPTAFGTVNSYGVWQPITYGGSYGTNGFRLPFTNNASTTTLGYDFSPQGNNWTTNNISVTAGVTYDSMTDVPTLTSATAANFAVLNPLDKATLASMSDGNLKLTNASAGDGGTRSTIACTDGMWYAELIVGSTTNANSAISFGLISTTVGIGAVSGYNTVNAFTLYASNLSQINNSGSITGAGSPFSAGDILQVAFDRTNNRAWVGKNNSWFDSSFGTTGNPSTAANPTFSSIPTTNPLAIFAYAYANSANANFGQQPFTYTPPTGFVALNTFNL